MGREELGEPDPRPRSLKGNRTNLRTARDASKRERRWEENEPEERGGACRCAGVQVCVRRPELVVMAGQGQSCKAEAGRCRLDTWVHTETRTRTTSRAFPLHPQNSETTGTSFSSSFTEPPAAVYTGREGRWELGGNELSRGEGHGGQGGRLTG